VNRGCPAAYFLLAIKQVSSQKPGFSEKTGFYRIKLKGRSIMGALPKRKISKSRRDRRRSHHALKNLSPGALPGMWQHEACPPRLPGLWYVPRPPDCAAAGKLVISEQSSVKTYC
jgi:hypothetical protein